MLQTAESRAWIRLPRWPQRVVLRADRAGPPTTDVCDGSTHRRMTGTFVNDHDDLPAGGQEISRPWPWFPRRTDVRSPQRFRWAGASPPLVAPTSRMRRRSSLRMYGARSSGLDGDIAPGT